MKKKQQSAILLLAIILLLGSLYLAARKIASKNSDSSPTDQITQDQAPIQNADNLPKEAYFDGQIQSISDGLVVAGNDQNQISFKVDGSTPVLISSEDGSNTPSQIAHLKVGDAVRINFNNDTMEATAIFIQSAAE